MEEYKEPYFIMIRASEAALRAMERGEFLLAQTILIRAQQQAEEKIISAADNNEHFKPHLFRPY